MTVGTCICRHRSAFRHAPPSRLAKHSCARCRQTTAEQSAQTVGIGRSGTLLVVIEIDENLTLLTLPLLNCARPSLQRRLGVVVTVVPIRSMTVDVDILCRNFPGRRGLV